MSINPGRQAELANRHPPKELHQCVEIREKTSDLPPEILLIERQMHRTV